MLKTDSHPTSARNKTLLFSLVLTLLLFSPTKPQRLERFCGIGCLRCDFEIQNCLLCDIQNFYFFDDASQTCLQKTPPNCLMALNPNFCHVCKPGHYPDFNGICLALTEKASGSGSPVLDDTSEEVEAAERRLQAVDGCDLHSGPSTCGKCGEGRFLNEFGKCEESLVKNKIHCLVFGRKRCLVCEIGHKWDKGFDSCLAKSKLKNCSSMNMKWLCTDDVCNDGLYPDINLNSLLENTIINSEDTYLRIITRIYALKNLNLFFNGPFLRNLLNLETVALTVLSKQSKPDYLKNGMLRLGNFTSLRGQRAGKFIKPDYQQCTSVVQLLFPFCQKINEKKALCVECVSGYVLNETNGICSEKARRVSELIANCQSMEFADACLVCRKGYQVSDSGTCVPNQVTNTNQNGTTNVIQTKTIQMRPKLRTPTLLDNKDIENTKNTESEKKAVQPSDSSSNLVDLPENQETNPENENSKNNKNDSTTNTDNDKDASNQNSKNTPQTPVTVPLPLPDLSTPKRTPLIESIDLPPEQMVTIPTLDLINQTGEQIPFPNNRKYVLRRKYKIYPYPQTQDSPSPTQSEREYLIVFTKGNVFMGFEQNPTRVDPEKPIMIEKNISQHCRVMILKDSLPSCMKCTDPNKFIMRPYSTQESKIFICVPRLVQTPNCATHLPDSCPCETCEDNFVLFKDSESDLRKCVAAVQNCEKQVFENNKLTCRECEQGFVLVAEKCVLKIEKMNNCKTVEANRCLACEEGYFLYSGKCLVQIASSFFFCLNDQQNDANCQCGTDAVEVQEINLCKPIGQDHCIEFDTNSKCTKCRNTYNLFPSGLCRIGEIESCKVYGPTTQNSQTCSICADGYTLENNKCRRSLQLFSSNCLKPEGEFCNKCDNSHYMISLDFKLEVRESLQVCAENVFYNSYQRTSHCLIFDAVSAKCMLCKDTFYLNSDGLCGTCDLATMGIDKHNTTCVQPLKPVDGCQLYDDQLCVKCKTKLPVLIEGNLFSTQVRVYNDRARNIFVERSEFVIEQCDVVLSEKCNTQNCNVAASLVSGDLCCSKCDWGRVGTWSQEDNVYYVQNCTDFMEFCDTSVRLKGVNMQYEQQLTCHFCLEGRVLKLNPVETESQLECVENPVELNGVEGCYLLVHEFCKLCKPKYAMVAEGGSDSHAQCQEISNCEFSETIGECERCQEGYSLTENSLSCVKSPISNCQRVADDNSCSECKGGMILHEGKSLKTCLSIDRPFCDRFDGENCVSCGTRSLKLKEGNSTLSEHLLIKLSISNNSAFTQSNKGICISSSTESANPQIQNCQEYQGLGQCRRCAQGFIINQETPIKKTCTAQLVDNPNCSQVTSSDHTCTHCTKHYYLEGDRCFKGQITACEKYLDQDNCEKCQEGYITAETQTGVSCFKNYQIDNCDVNNSKFMIDLQNGSVSNYQLDCSKCASNYFKKPSSNAVNMCFRMALIEHCRETDPITSKCAKCEDLFFLQDEPNQSRTCVRRKSLNIQHCLKFDIKTDGCGQCEDAFTLSEDKTSCQKKVIQTVKGCVLAKGLGFKCVICDSQHFLNAENGKCQEIETKADHCVEYISKSECQTCANGYYLKSISELERVCAKDKDDFKLNERNMAETVELITQKTQDSQNEQNKVIEASNKAISESVPVIVSEPVTVTVPELVISTETVLETLPKKETETAETVETAESKDNTGENLKNANDDNLVNEFEELSEKSQELADEEQPQASEGVLSPEPLENSTIPNIMVETTVNSGSNSQGIDNFKPRGEDPTVFQRILQDMSAETVKMLVEKGKSEATKHLTEVAKSKAKDISNSLANTATDTIVGKGANPIVKELVSTTIKNKINDKSDQITGDSVSTINETIKGHVQSLNERYKTMTPQEIEDIKNFVKGKDPSDFDHMIKNVDPEKGTDKKDGDAETNSATIGTNVESTKGGKKDSTTDESQENHAKGIFCGLCEQEYNFSTVSNRCTKNPEKGCLLLNKGANSTEIPCIVCVAGYFHNQFGECILNLNIKMKSTLLRVIWGLAVVSLAAFF